MAEEATPEPANKPEINLKKVEEAVIKEHPKIFQNIPKGQREEIVRAVFSTTKIHNGPLPPLELIEGYENLHQGSAKLIFEIFEKQSLHRMKMEDTVITTQQIQSGRGQNYALMVALSFLAVAGVCILTGHDVAGGVLGSVDVLGIVTIFITGTAKKSNSLKQKDLPAPNRQNKTTQRGVIQDKRKRN
jgi:uncharacterized membrane protein